MVKIEDNSNAEREKKIKKEIGKTIGKTVVGPLRAETLGRALDIERGSLRQHWFLNVDELKFIQRHCALHLYRT